MAASTEKQSMISGLFGSRMVWPMGVRRNSLEPSANAETSTPATESSSTMPTAGALGFADIDRLLKEPLLHPDFRTARRDDLIEMIGQLLRQREAALALLSDLKAYGDAQSLQVELRTVVEERRMAAASLEKLQTSVEALLQKELRRENTVAIPTPDSATSAATEISVDVPALSESTPTEPISTLHCTTESLSASADHVTIESSLNASQHLEAELLSVKIKMARSELEASTQLNEVKRLQQADASRQQYETQKLREEMARSASEAASVKSRLHDLLHKFHAAVEELDALRLENHRLKHSIFLQQFAVTPSVQAPLTSRFVAGALGGGHLAHNHQQSGHFSSCDSSDSAVVLQLPENDVTTAPPILAEELVNADQRSLFGLILKKSRHVHVTDAAAGARDSVDTNGVSTEITSPSGLQSPGSSTNGDMAPAPKLMTSSWSLLGPFSQSRTESAPQSARVPETAETTIKQASVEAASKTAHPSMWSASFNSLFAPSVSVAAEKPEPASQGTQAKAAERPKRTVFKLFQSLTQSPVVTSAQKPTKRPRSCSLPLVSTRLPRSVGNAIASDLHHSLLSSLLALPTLSSLGPSELEQLLPLFHLKLLDAGARTEPARKLVYVVTGSLLSCSRSGLAEVEPAEVQSGCCTETSTKCIYVAPRLTVLLQLDFRSWRPLITALQRQHSIVPPTVAPDERAAAVCANLSRSLTLASSVSAYTAGVRRYGSMLNGIKLPASARQSLPDARMKEFEQALRDFVREPAVIFNGVSHTLGSFPKVFTFISDMFTLISKEIRGDFKLVAKKDSVSGQSFVERIACQLIVDILVASSRTATGGDSYAFVHGLFHKDSVAFVAAESGVQAPVEIFLSGGVVLIQSINLYKICAHDDPDTPRQRQASMNTIAMLRCRLTETLRYLSTVPTPVAQGLLSPPPCPAGICDIDSVLRAAAAPDLRDSQLHDAVRELDALAASAGESVMVKRSKSVDVGIVLDDH